MCCDSPQGCQLMGQTWRSQQHLWTDPNIEIQGCQIPDKISARRKHGKIIISFSRQPARPIPTLSKSIFPLSRSNTDETAPFPAQGAVHFVVKRSTSKIIEALEDCENILKAPKQNSERGTDLIRCSSQPAWNCCSLCLTSVSSITRARVSYVLNHTQMSIARPFHQLLCKKPPYSNEVLC